MTARRRRRRTSALLILVVIEIGEECCAFNTNNSQRFHRSNRSLNFGLHPGRQQRNKKRQEDSGRHRTSSTTIPPVLLKSSFVDDIVNRATGQGDIYDNDDDPTIFRLELDLEMERQLQMRKEPPIATLTWFTLQEDETSETGVQFLQERANQIANTNPWLQTGFLRRQSLFNPTESAELIFQSPFEQGPKIEIASAQDAQLLERYGHDRPLPGRSTEYRATRKYTSIQEYSSKSPMWRITVVPAYGSFGLILSVSHLVADIHTYYKIYDMLTNPQQEIGTLDLNTPYLQNQNDGEYSYSDDLAEFHVGGPRVWKFIHSPWLMVKGIMGILERSFWRPMVLGASPTDFYWDIDENGYRVKKLRPQGVEYWFEIDPVELGLVKQQLIWDEEGYGMDDSVVEPRLLPPYTSDIPPYGDSRRTNGMPPYDVSRRRKGRTNRENYDDGETNRRDYTYGAKTRDYDDYDYDRDEYDMRESRKRTPSFPPPVIEQPLSRRRQRRQEEVTLRRPDDEDFTTTLQQEQQRPSIYVSTNDMLSAWFFQTIKCRMGLICCNYRGKLEGHHEYLARNYWGTYALTPDQFSSPFAVRKHLQLPSASERAFPKLAAEMIQAEKALGIVSSWTVPFESDTYFPVESHWPLYDFASYCPANFVVLRTWWIQRPEAQQETNSYDNNNNSISNNSRRKNNDKRKGRIGVYVAGDVKWLAKPVETWGMVPTFLREFLVRRG